MVKGNNWIRSHYNCIGFACVCAW